MLEVHELSKTYSSSRGDTHAIADISLTVNDDEFCSIVGPSGCGKTTLLKCLSGLLTPTTGHVTLDGREVNGAIAEMAVVFQDYSRSLLPWLTVKKNAMLPLKGRLSKDEANEVVGWSLDEVGLGEFADHYPWQLSGGMQQRTAIARALAFRPRILLLDEPMASVDAQTRNDLEDLILKLRDDIGLTVLLVTHDIDESVYMSDRVVVLSSAPTRVRQEIVVDLPRPRDQVGTKSMSEFTNIRNDIYKQISAEASRAQRD